MPSVAKRVRRAARMLPWLALCLAGCATPSGRRVSLDPELNRRAEEAHQVLRQAGPARAAVLYVELADLARRRGEDQAFSALSYNLAACRFELGDPEGALASLRESLDAALRIGSPTDEILALEARVRHAMGQSAQTSELLEEELREARFRRQPDLLASLEIQQAEFELDRGRPDEAKAALGAAKTGCDRARPPCCMRAWKG